MKSKVTQDTVVKDIIRVGKKAEDAERYGEALKAQYMLGKYVGLFSDSVDVNIRTPPQLIVQFSGESQLLTEG